MQSFAMSYEWCGVAFMGCVCIPFASPPSVTSRACLPFPTPRKQLRLLEKQAPGFSFAIAAVAGAEATGEGVTKNTLVFRSSDDFPGRMPLFMMLRLLAQVRLFAP